VSFKLTKVGGPPFRPLLAKGGEAASHHNHPCPPSPQFSKHFYIVRLGGLGLDEARGRREPRPFLARSFPIRHQTLGEGS
jgi:hypothetical protein